jgi:hypothetical protein
MPARCRRHGELIWCMFCNHQGVRAPRARARGRGGTAGWVGGWVGGMARCFEGLCGRGLQILLLCLRGPMAANKSRCLANGDEVRKPRERGAGVMVS